MLENETIRVIKKYQNRKLYDTKDSCYITLEEIAELIRKGEEIKVIDNRTKSDVTSIILTQILVDQEKSAKSILPLTMLREIIQKGQGSLFDFIQRYVLLGIENEQERRTEAQRYIDRLVTRGDLTKVEGKNLLKEVLDTPEHGREDFDQVIGEKVSASVREMSKLSDIEQSIKGLSDKLDTIERKLITYEHR